MKTVLFSNTGIEVSALCLGTDHYGSRTPTERAFQLLDIYFEAGGSFIDTANVYAAWLPGFEGSESAPQRRTCPCTKTINSRKPCSGVTEKGAATTVS